MKTPKLLYWLDRPWVVIGGLLLSLWFAQIWLRAERQLEPPSLRSGSWRGQPPTILVRFNGTGGCGCSTALKDGYKRCLENGIAYYVVASESVLARHEIHKPDFPGARFLSEEEAHFALPLARGKSETLFIVNGRIRKRWAGVSITKGMLVQ